MSKHLVIDFETMGKDAQKCAVIDCSVMIFDMDRMLSSNPYGLEQNLFTPSTDNNFK